MFTKRQLHDDREFRLLVEQLTAEGCKPGDGFIFSGQTTITIDGVDVTIREAIAAKKRGGSIREQIQKAKDRIGYEFQ